MPIIRKDRFFGEGVSNYGAETFQDAYRQHKHYLRKKRLEDTLGGGDKSLSPDQIAARFSELEAAVKAADKQAQDDNIELLGQIVTEEAMEND